MPERVSVTYATCAIHVTANIIVNVTVHDPGAPVMVDFQNQDTRESVELPLTCLTALLDKAQLFASWHNSVTELPDEERCIQGLQDNDDEELVLEPLEGSCHKRLSRKRRAALKREMNDE